MKYRFHDGPFPIDGFKAKPKPKTLAALNKLHREFWKKQGVKS